MYFELPDALHQVVDALVAPVTYGVVLPLTAVYHTLRYLVSPPAHLGLKHYLALNLARVRAQWTRGPWVNYLDPDRDRIIPSPHSAFCNVVKVTIPALSEGVPRISVLAARGAEKVPAKKVTTFVIQPKSDADPLRPAQAGERAILYLVGGGYAHGHPLAPHTGWSLSRISGARLFGVNYRKSLDDASAFPGSLLDSLAGWQYVMSLGFEPANIMLSGDSAGANACLALARYLDELAQAGFNWGQAGAMCLHCPWSDMTCSFPSLARNKYTDHLIDLAPVYIPSHTRHFSTRADAYLSPALASDSHFSRLAAGGTRVYMLAYAAEGFRDEIVALKDKMRGAGVDVALREIPGGAHSEFVWMDRHGLLDGGLGWSWPTVAADFEAFWLGCGEERLKPLN